MTCEDPAETIGGLLSKLVWWAYLCCKCTLLVLLVKGSLHRGELLHVDCNTLICSRY